MLERSQKYDRSFVRRCMAGPNALYLTEELTDSMSLAPRHGCPRPRLRPGAPPPFSWRGNTASPSTRWTRTRTPRPATCCATWAATRAYIPSGRTPPRSPSPRESSTPWSASTPTTTSAWRPASLRSQAPVPCCKPGAPRSAFVLLRPPTSRLRPAATTGNQNPVFWSADGVAALVRERGPRRPASASSSRAPSAPGRSG